MAPFRAGQQIHPPEDRPRHGDGGDDAGPAPARLVLTSTWLIASTSAALPSASCEPPLKPNQPNQRMNTPRVTTGMFDGGVLVTEPSLRNLLCRGPTTSAPARAAAPPVPCNDGRSGEVLEAHRVQPAAAPCPGADDRVDECGQHQGEDEERPELDPLGQRTGDDGRGGSPRRTIWKNQSDMTA